MGGGDTCGLAASGRPCREGVGRAGANLTGSVGNPGGVSVAVRTGGRLKSIPGKGIGGLLAAAALFALLGLLVGYAGLSVYARAHLNHKLDALRAQGVRLTVRELTPPMPSAERNAASLYQQAFETVDLQQSERDQILGLVRQAAGRASVRAILQRNAHALELAHQAAQRPECVFPQSAAISRDYGRLHNLALLLSSQALLAAGDGDCHAATDSLLDCIAMSDAPSSGPTTIGQMTSWALRPFAIDAIPDVLQHASSPPADCSRLAARLAEIDVMGGFARGQQGYRAEMVEEYRTATAEAASLEFESGTSRIGRYLALIYTSPVFRPLHDLEEATLLDLRDEQIKSAAHPWREAKDRLDTLEGSVEDSCVSRLPAVRWFAGPLSHGLLMRDAAIARLAIAQAALGLQAYRATYGGYPASLDDLKTKLKWPLRKDPFSGGDVVYKRTGDTFVLYSLGANLKDDGGRAAGGMYGDLGDIVWAGESWRKM